MEAGEEVVVESTGAVPREVEFRERVEGVEEVGTDLATQEESEMEVQRELAETELPRVRRP